MLVGDKKKDITAGVFVAVGLLLAIISVFFVGSDYFIFKSSYTLLARFSQVQGLGVGSVVSYAGLPVGNIKEIRWVGGDRPLETVLRLDRDYIDQITPTTLASIKTQGALGDKYIYLEPGEPGLPALKPGGQLKIKEEPDLFDTLAKKGPELAKITDVIQEVYVLLNNLNANGRSDTLFKNMADSSQELHQVLKEIRLMTSQWSDKPSHDIKESLHHLAQILKKVDEGRGTLGALVNNADIYNGLVRFLGESPRSRYMKPLIRATIQTQDQTTKP